MSKKSAIGSTLYAQGPPHTSNGKSISRSFAYIGIPAKSSIFRILVKLISYCSVNASTSKSLIGVRVSKENKGILRFRISSSISCQGANTRSATASSRRLTKPYRILMPKWLIATSYTSGNPSAIVISTVL